MKKMIFKIILVSIIILCGVCICKASFADMESLANGMSEAEKASFNNRFLKYEGDKQKGSIVKAMINEINTSNAESDTDKHIQIIGETDIQTNLVYKVKCNYGETGRINEIVIEKVSDSSNTNSSTNTSANSAQNSSNLNNLNSNGVNNNTNKETKLPKTGENSFIVEMVLIAFGIAIILAIILRNYKDVK